MPTLFSYCIPSDDGAAPNPFWNVCTLVICKPVIRRKAEVGDWIVATGSKQFGFENKVVYAMEVTKKLSMQKYDEYCKNELQQKIPNKKSKKYEDRVGDCIYDYSTEPALIREGVHNEGNRPRDEGGVNALLSEHFYYFGKKPVLLPLLLLPIVKQGQGHKSKSNDPYYQTFIDWILTKFEAKNKVYSYPKGFILSTKDCNYESKCATIHKKYDDMDEELENEKLLKTNM